ncbi:MAG: hypothetical protein V7735_11295 [Photobacterium frigidiphilum]|uniref:Uncharacterized protein n=1 Tax=Photobacterium frigidiphilum TaxID=264736 RepID=A0A2T3JGS8_9GAMM|nr:hypothetical protein C9J12_13190 [Photobacterium frigidiphilum]
MVDKTLIADTKDVFEAFLDNGLHREYAIYCQFPHYSQKLYEFELNEAKYIEFNDGYRCGNQ